MCMWARTTGKLGEQKGSWTEKKGMGEMKDYTTKKISRCKRHKKKSTQKVRESCWPSLKQGGKKKDDMLRRNSKLSCLRKTCTSHAKIYYTPYLAAKRSWMAGGKEATWAAQPASSCCLNPWSRVWNILFNSGEGWFQRMMELQNHSKLYMKERHKLDLGDHIDELQ